MGCLDEDDVLAWLDGSTSRHEEIEAHIDRCTECRKLVSTLADDTVSVGDVPAPAASAAMLGTVVDDRYELEAIAGRGGMGRVYRARDRVTGNRVALKQVEVDDARFAREADVLASLEHSGIVGYVANGRDGDGTRYLVMEWLEGEDLGARLERGPLTVEETLVLGRTVASALAAAHAGGVVHRDVKPKNLFLVDGRVERAKVVDFGLARTETATMRTRTGALVGTPSYMAPEQARGDRDIGPAADVFSLGSVLYECLTGEKAFGGAHVLAVLSNLLTVKAPRPRARAGHVPRGLDDLVARMLSRDASKRPPNGAAVEVELAVIGSLRSLLRSVRFGLAVGAAVAIVGGLGATAFALRATRPSPPGPPPVARHTIVENVPPALPFKPGAVVEYRAGIDAIREASLERARLHLEAATTQEPTFAAAHLRLAIWTDTIMTAADCRAHFQAAQHSANTLDERDRELLNAIEPGYASEPPDLVEAQRRLAAIAQRRPHDAELLLLGIGVSGGKTRPEDYAHVLELDPKFAYAWWAKANAFYRVNDLPASRTALDSCAGAAPRSTLCRLLRARVDSRDGRCADVESGAREIVALENGGEFGYAHLANALTARGADRAAVEQVIASRAAGVVNESARKRTLMLDRAALAAAYGDFVGAEKELKELAELVRDEPFAQDHLRGVNLLVDVLDERGDVAAAGRIADEFLRRRAGFRSVAFRPNDDPVPVFLAAAVRAKVRTPESAATARDAWSAEWQKKLGGATEELWLQEWARPAQTPAELAVAAAHMPAGAASSVILPAPPGWVSNQGFTNYHGARVQLAAGHVAAAVTTLGSVAHHCAVLVDAVTHRRASLWLGKAHEALGETAPACAAYRSVVDVWGNARPRSVSAEAAKARLRALSCPVEPRP